MGDLPLKRADFRCENSGRDEPWGGQSMPRGKREPADPIILKLREATLEVSRGKTVIWAAKKIGVTEQAQPHR